MLAVTSGFADQASLKAELLGNPTEDFSGKSSGELHSLADADAMVYLETHSDYNTLTYNGNAGLQHAFKHNLMGDEAYMYAVIFYRTLDTLTAGDK